MSGVLVATACRDFTLPSGQRRGSTGGRSVMEIPRVVTAEIGKGLSRIAAVTGAPPINVAAVAWGILVARLSDIDHIRVGVISAGTGEELQLYLPLCQYTTAEALLSNQVMLAANPSSPQEPHTRPATAVRSGALDKKGISSLRIDSEHDIVLTLPPDGDDTVASIEYDQGLYDDEDILRALTCYRQVIRSIEQDPHRPIRRIPLVTSQERKRILSKFTRGTARRRCVGVDSVPASILDQSRRQPDRVALSSADETVSYGQLEGESARLAAKLRDVGVGPGSVVAVRAERSPAVVSALLAILRAGAAYLCVEPDCPWERFAFMMMDAQVKAVMTDRPLPSNLPGCAVVEFSAGTSAEAAGLVSKPALLFGADSPAYVVYTSGSSGRPKGVVNSHRGLSGLVDWAIRAFQLGPADRCSQVSALGFDASVLEIWPVLCAGGELAFSGPDERKSVMRLRDWLVEREITVTFAPTPVAELLMQRSWPDHAALRLMLTGGDRLQMPPPPGFPFRLINMYGPSEASVVATCQIVEPARNSDALPNPSIGKPRDGTCVYILDREQQLLPLGFSGELCIGGDGLALGYLSRPALTAERFVPNPFHGPGDPSPIIYRTGDRGRYDRDGNLAFLGRIDNQVKINGIRIEPEEVESVLLEDSVVRAAIVTVEEGSAGKRLVGYVTPREGCSYSWAEVRDRLHQRLPHYMVPHQGFVLDELPLTDRGKIDRQALRRIAADPQGTCSMRVGAEPSSTSHPSMLQQICTAWSMVLLTDSDTGVDVSPDDDFFDLGGDSMVAMRIAVQLGDEGLDVNPGDILKRRTPRALHSALRASSS